MCVTLGFCVDSAWRVASLIFTVQLSTLERVSRKLDQSRSSSFWVPMLHTGSGEEEPQREWNWNGCHYDRWLPVVFAPVGVRVLLWIRLSGPPNLMLVLRYHSWRDFLRSFMVPRIAPGSEMCKARALPDVLLLCFYIWHKLCLECHEQVEEVASPQPQANLMGVWTWELEHP